MVDTRGIEAVVIGGSAGAFAALKVLLPALPASLNVPVIIVLHVPDDRPNAIAEIFSKQSERQVKEADDKEPLEPGTVYFAPPGYHLLVESDRSLALATDQPVHFSRPSIDVLFESAADAFGSRLLGLLLSGANEDGAAGMKAIRERGGLTLVQQPDSAAHPTMPNAAISVSVPTAILSVEEMAAVLAGLGAQRSEPQHSRPRGGNV